MILHDLMVFIGLREEPKVPAYGWSYFDHMVAVYLTLNVDDPRAAAIIEKAKARPYGISWGDIFLLENIILALQPPDTVVRNAWIQRERFREIAGPTMYARYVESGIPTATDTPEKVALLRADLTRIMDFLHWYYELIPIRERRRKLLTMQCIGMVTLYTVALAVSMFYLREHRHAFLATMVCVVYFGIVGGFVSSQRRMQNIPADGDPLISVFGLENAGYYLWLSPLLGAIFAAVLTLMFMGGVLKGTVFPSFVEVDPREAMHSMFALARLALPSGPSDYAMLYIWCFMAGFAERLVPDSLDRLASRLDPSNQPQISTPKSTPDQPQGAPQKPAERPLSKGTLDNAMLIHDERPAADDAKKPGGS